MENVTQWRKYLERCFKIQLTRDFKEDISDIYNYIRKDSVYYATKTKNEIMARIFNLSFMPFIGRKLVDSENNNILNQKEIIYKSYRIIYGINSETIYVRRVLHSARLLSKNLIKV